MTTEENKVNTFKDSLITLMKERGETVTSISKAIGVSKSTVSEWCAGRKPLLDESIIKLARLLGVSVERLISGSEPEHDLVDSFLGQMNDGFISIHNGMYRVKVEKFVGKKKSGKRE